jgi:hypothetical protein
MHRLGIVIVASAGIYLLGGLWWLVPAFAGTPAVLVITVLYLSCIMVGRMIPSTPERVGGSGLVNGRRNSLGRLGLRRS